MVMRYLFNCKLDSCLFRCGGDPDALHESSTVSLGKRGNTLKTEATALKRVAYVAVETTNRSVNRLELKMCSARGLRNRFEMEMFYNPYPAKNFVKSFDSSEKGSVVLNRQRGSPYL